MCFPITGPLVAAGAIQAGTGAAALVPAFTIPASTVFSTGLAVANFAVQSIGSVARHQAQEATFRAQRDRFNQQVVNAFAAARNEQRQLTLRQLQEQEASAERIKLSRLEEAEAKATAKVRSAASGVSGLSIDALITDLGRRAARNREIERRNLMNTAQRLRTEQRATIDRARGRIVRATPTAARPSPVVPLLGIASAGISLGRDLNPRAEAS